MKRQRRRTTKAVPNELRKERLLGEVCVVLAQEVDGSPHELHGHQLEALRLKPGDDLTGQTSVNGVGFEHQKCSLPIAETRTGYRRFLDFRSDRLGWIRLRSLRLRFGLGLLSRTLG